MADSLTHALVIISHENQPRLCFRPRLPGAIDCCWKRSAMTKPLGFLTSTETGGADPAVGAYLRSPANRVIPYRSLPPTGLRPGSFSASPLLSALRRAPIRLLFSPSLPSPPRFLSSSFPHPELSFHSSSFLAIVSWCSSVLVSPVDGILDILITEVSRPGRLGAISPWRLI